MTVLLIFKKYIIIFVLKFYFIIQMLCFQQYSLSFFILDLGFLLISLRKRQCIRKGKKFFKAKLFYNQDCSVRKIYLLSLIQECQNCPIDFKLQQFDTLQKMTTLCPLKKRILAFQLINSGMLELSYRFQTRLVIHNTVKYKVNIVATL